MINWPAIEAMARPEKNDCGGSSLLKRSTGSVILMVIKMGNVTNKS